MLTSTHIEHATIGIMSHMLSHGGEYVLHSNFEKCTDYGHSKIDKFCSLVSWNNIFFSYLMAAACYG